MVCPSGDPWTNCLDVRCVVDPYHPAQAICYCQIERTGEFTTAGGNCDTSTCKHAYWSAATIPSYEQGVAFLLNALHLSQSPAKWCPI